VRMHVDDALPVIHGLRPTARAAGWGFRSCP
jgi:hypothetical protein